MATLNTTTPNGEQQDAPAVSSFDLLEELSGALDYAMTYAHMIYDLLGQPAEDDINDPASRTQRMYACILPLQDRLMEIDAAQAQLRGMVAP